MKKTISYNEPYVKLGAILKLLKIGCESFQPLSFLCIAYMFPNRFSGDLLKQLDCFYSTVFNNGEGKRCGVSIVYDITRRTLRKKVSQVPA